MQELFVLARRQGADAPVTRFGGRRYDFRLLSGNLSGCLIKASDGSATKS